MNFDACRQCCADYEAWAAEVKATKPGETARKWPRQRCESPDCALYDTLLRRLANQDGYAPLSRTLSRIRELIMTRARPKTQRAFAPAATSHAAATAERDED